MAKKFNKKEKDKISAMLDKYTVSIRDARKYGKQVGKRITARYASDGIFSPKNKGLVTDSASEVLSEILFQCYKKGEEDGCHELLKKWVEEKFWGKIVTEHLPDFEALWQELRIKKHDKNNPFVYGDMSGSVWIERSKNKKIVIHKSPGRTHIFIMEKGVFGPTFHVRTVWPRENNKGGYAVKKSKKYPDGWFSWGDDRDVKTPSLNTYRKRNFEYSYRDCRDKGYVLTIDGMALTPSVELGGHFQPEIEHALWLIKIMKEHLAREGEE